MENLSFMTVAAITALCYLVGLGLTLSPLDNRWIPLLCGVCGALLGLAGLYAMPEFPADNLIDALAVGAASGLAATGVDQLGRQIGKDEEEWK